ncbi:hypothetical protein ATANTOWER_024386, partial [Ataeniobius toweri]|nr:hypothetical protein [Ataeniobius toweri]
GHAASTSTPECFTFVVQFLDQAQAPLENLPDLAFTAKTSSSDPQVKFQLAASEPPTSSFYRANPVHPPTSGTSEPCPPSHEWHLRTLSKEKHLNQVQIPEKKDSRFYVYPGLLRVSQTQNVIPPGRPSTPEISEKFLSRFIPSPLLWQNKLFKLLRSSECYLHVPSVRSPPEHRKGVTGRCCGAAVAHQRAINLGSKGVEIQKEASARCLTKRGNVSTGVSVSGNNFLPGCPPSHGSLLSPWGLLIGVKHKVTLLSPSTIVVKTYPSLTWLRAYLLEIPILSADPVRIPERI